MACLQYLSQAALAAKVIEKTEDAQVVMFAGKVVERPIVVSGAAADRVVHVVTARISGVTDSNARLHSTISKFQVFRAPAQPHALIESTEFFQNGAIDRDLAAGAADPTGFNIAGIVLKPALEITLEGSASGARSQ